MAAPMAEILSLCGPPKSCKIVSLKVKKKYMISKGTLIATFKPLDGESGSGDSSVTEKFKANVFGTVEEILVNAGDVLNPGSAILKYLPCSHPTVMKDMCAECGADLRETAGFPGQRSKTTTASVAMVHSIPELQVSKEEALKLASQDEERLLKSRKLTLVVDLDQTVIHTTMENIKPNLPGVKHFQLWGSGRQTPWYHTKIRPGCKKFFEVISKYYELHIFTMGARLYAHTIAGFLDPDQRFFSHRILSRDECFDPNSKTANLKSIFPCGDSMVCIIDDRDDVWNFAPNLIQVVPYRYFEGTGDINSPPGLPPNNPAASKTDIDSKEGKSSTPGKGDDERDGKVDDDDATDISKDKTENVTGKDSKNDSKSDLESDLKNDSNVKDGDMEVEDSDSKVKTDSDVKGQESNVKQDDSNIEEDVGTKVVDKDPKDETEKSKQTKKDGGELEEGELEKDPSDEKPKSADEKQDSGKTQDKKTEGDSAKKKPSKDEDLQEDCTDDYFLHLEEILIRIHAAFFKNYDKSQDKSLAREADLKTIVPWIRTHVLSGVYIVFSGVFPTNMPPEQSRAWKTAVALGAKVSSKIIPRDKTGSGPANATTHVIAAKVGTNKVHNAQRCKKVHIVTADWLWCCWERWERADERLFILPGIKALTQESTPPNSDSDASTKRALNKKRKGTPEGKSKPKQKRAKTQGDSGIDEATGSSTSGSGPRQSLSSEYNPLYSFSSEELQNMDKEVQDIFGEDSSSSDESDDATSAATSNQESLGSITQMISSSSEESLTGENPRGWSPKPRPKRDSDQEKGNDSGDSTSSPGVSEGGRSSGDEDLMAEAIDDLLSYSKVPTVKDRLNLERR